MIETEFLFVSLLEGFEWFDESLQMSLKAAGLPPLSRSESMIMIHVQMGITRPAEIARSLRLTRQAVHQSIASLADRGIFELRPDPDDGRVKVVQCARMRTGRRVLSPIFLAIALDSNRWMPCDLRSGTRGETLWNSTSKNCVRRSTINPDRNVVTVFRERRSSLP